MNPETDPVRQLPRVIAPQPGKKRAAGWQIALTAVGLVAIVTVFLWGINNQRDETEGRQSAATTPMPAASQNADGRQSPSTTGQGSHEGGEGGVEQKPIDSNGEPAERQPK
jgi:hypothetical protein